MYKDKEKLREYHREYMRMYNRNPKFMAYRREWMKAWHRKNQKEIYRRRRARKYENFASTIRTRMIRYLIRGYVRKTETLLKTETLFGISIERFKAYIESKFMEGMSWSNHGKWQFDHIVPLSSFDFSKEEDQKRASHYTNVQPLWAKDNMAKYTKVI